LPNIVSHVLVYLGSAQTAKGSNAVKLKPFHFEVVRKIFHEMDARFLQEFCKKACAILEKPFFFV
jgi:hypothetical protein